MLTDRNIALGSALISLLSFVVAAGAFTFSYRQYHSDYDEEVTLKANTWPITPISSTTPSELQVEVRNTSKQNLEYFLRITGNAICVSEKEVVNPFESCQYTSRSVRISKPEAGANAHVHTLYIMTTPAKININPLAYSSDPDYFIRLEVVSARTNMPLYNTLCYYEYIANSHSLVLYRPLLDTTGQSKVLQARCM